MQIDSTMISILEDICTNGSLSILELESKYNFTKRQLRYCIEKIDEYLMSEGFNLIVNDSEGFFAINHERCNELMGKISSIKVKNYYFSKEERIRLIILFIISKEEELSLQHFISALKVSKNTVLNDIKAAQKLLDAYNLEIQYSRSEGYEIVGNEFNIRKCLLEMINSVLNLYNEFLNIKELCHLEEKNLKEFRDRLISIEDELHVTFTDERMETISYCLTIVKRRISLGKRLSKSDIIYEELIDTKEYQIADRFMSEYGELSKEERFFITLTLLSANLSTLTLDALSEPVVLKLKIAIEQSIRNCEMKSCVFIPDKSTLISNILQHLRPAYYRTKYNLTLFNTFVEVVNKESHDKYFIEFYKIVEKSFEPVNEIFGCKIPEIELKCITLIILSWIGRQGKKIRRSLRAMIVCPNGVSASVVLHSTLRDIFPEILFYEPMTIREFKEFDENEYDIVFAPIYIHTSKKLFVVNLPLTQNGKNKLRNMVTREVYGSSSVVLNVDRILEIIDESSEIKDRKKLKADIKKYLFDELGAEDVSAEENETPNLSGFITDNHIQITEQVIDWKQAIEIASMPLLKEGYINQSYVQAMLDQYSWDSRTVIWGYDMALVHSKPSAGGNRVGMALLKLKKGVAFAGGKSVHVVVALSAIDKKRHLKAVLQLSNLALNKENMASIVEATTKKEIIEVLKKYDEKL
ncbi:BglG family transcription antiterminator [Sporanaerobacter sp. PP17-6a]|uniref:BglG family transcription antiterminator n=1 Tax=Sporanaerobacter sp. PP17-6a TaxID=1891289 RepID=UPI00089FA17B|nr:BglG family transcription antiterminator [Sporanaerobacter sp. PP17-6a]SCL88334.1 Mannitol operon transcriptional activator [Sporanaerobacter sp. PP17-6a]